MLSKAKRKIYASLAGPKGRRETGLFMAQGTKCVLDTIDYFPVDALLCTREWAEQHPGVADLHPTLIATPDDLAHITTLQTPPDVIAVYRIPDPCKPVMKDRLLIALDGVQDPGNLGTIMRTADWFGVTDIIASEDTVDVFNPKVVQATMGAISRVNVTYTDLPAFLSQCKGTDIYGTFLEGENINTAALTPGGIIVMGNEGRGIRPATAVHINRKLHIPPFPPGRTTSESLNVSIATAITLYAFRQIISC